MKDVVFGFFAIIALPVLIVLAIAGASGVLTKGVKAVADAESVNGFTLDELIDYELRAVGGSDTQFYPFSTVIGSFQRQATSIALGRDIEPLSGHVVLASARYSDVVTYYREILAADGWVPIDVPTPLSAFGEEIAPVTFRKDNVVFRLVMKTDPRVLVEAGGSSNDTVYEYLITPLFPAGSS